MAYAMAMERQMIREDLDLAFRDFRRCRIRYTPDANPDEADQNYMKSRGSTRFRVRLANLLATQCYVYVPAVEKYMWQVRNHGVAYLALPNVELVNGCIVVVDGHHRIEALRRLGRKSVAVRFHPSHWWK